MKIQAKTPELIQAQIAAFASEKIEYNDTKRYIFNNISSLAVSNVAKVTYESTSDEPLHDKNRNYTENNTAVIPKETERTTATKDSYFQYLRSVGGSHHEAIATRNYLLEQYTHFEPDITRLASELESVKSQKDHPAYLGSGSNTSAFRISHEDKEYAVRISEDAMDIDERAVITARASGVPHLEQVVAMSYDNCAVVTELMPGTELGYDTPIENMRQVTNKQLSDLVDTIVTATGRGIAIDPKPTNIFYDPQEGFGIIDLSPANAKTELGNTAGSIATSLSNTGFYGKHLSKITPEAYERDLAWHKVHLDLVTRYRAAVIDKLSNEALEGALGAIDKQIEYIRDEIKQLSDPDEIAKRIVYERKLAEQKTPTGSWTTV